MNKKYENSIHRLGRIGVIIGICFMLGIPAVISTAFHVWPENIGKLLTACVGLLAIYLPTNVAEVLGYTPMAWLFCLYYISYRKCYQLKNSGCFECPIFDRCGPGNRRR